MARQTVGTQTGGKQVAGAQAGATHSAAGGPRFRLGPRSGCPIATTLDMVGDRWSLVIMRDMVNGKTRFSEFIDSPERITTNVLTDRLARMEAAGLIERVAYREHPPRFDYLLTEKGAALLPVLQEICRWANAFMPETWTPPDSFMKKPPG